MSHICPSSGILGQKSLEIGYIGRILLALHLSETDTKSLDLRELQILCLTFKECNDCSCIGLRYASDFLFYDASS